MESENSYPEGEKANPGFLLIARLKNAIDKGNLDIYSLYSSKDQAKNN